MGAHRLWLWSARDGAGQAPALAALEDAVMDVGGAHAGRWSATVAAHRAASQEAGRRPAAQPAKDLHIVSLSQAAEKSYLVARAEGQIIEADSVVQKMLGSYNVYKHRSSLQLEGSMYAAGDFRIALARAAATPGNEFRGLVVDAEYLPLAAPAAAAAVLAELGQLLQEAAEAAVPGAVLRHAEPSCAAFGLPEAYSDMHLAVALVQLAAAA